MNVLAAIRRRQKRWTPRLSALLAIVWVGMLWQPCASATGMDGDAGHAGHAETTLPAEHPGHLAPASHAGDTGHGEQDQSESHCPHCPSSAHADCATLTEACASLDRFDADRRTAKLNFGAGADEVPQVPLPRWTELRPLPRPTVSAVTDGCGSIPQGPPPNILFCVYLS